MDSNRLEEYYNQALDFTKSHYENFPVVSFLVKKELRKYVAVVYQYARQADDIVDEGNHSQDKRISELNSYQNELINSIKTGGKTPFWQVVANTISSNSLNVDNFLNLLKAFRQDVWKNRYENYNELLEYCNNSANPVGRIILELNNIKEEDAFELSDKICTALQLTNFYQDVRIDIDKGRIYIPLDELKIFHVTEEDIKNKTSNENFIKLIKYEVERTKKLFVEGRKLLIFLPFRLKLHILITIKGGETILKKIEEINYRVLELRPTLSKMEIIKIFFTAIIFWK